MATASATGDATQSLQNLKLDPKPKIIYEEFKSELQLEAMTKLISKDLSEPYSIYTYRYFLHCWPDLSFLAFDSETKEIIGCVICKIDIINTSQYIDPSEYNSIQEQLDSSAVKRGYIGMLAIDDRYRRLGIASKLVELSIDNMKSDKYKCSSVMLETEITNRGALNLYDNLGFIRDERLYRYYLNGQDALRLILHLDEDDDREEKDL